ncbi:MAG: PAS domain-containing protein, partial [Peptostreptococcaceae bacterium]
MRYILDSSNDYILVLDRNMNIKYCNKKFLYKIEIDEKDILNKNIECIIDTDLSKMQNNFKGFKINIDLNISYKSKYVTRLRCNILTDKFENEESIFIIGEEIDNQSYTREDLELLLDNMPFNAWIKCPDGKYKYTNDSYAKSCGTNKTDIIGKSDSNYWDES